MHGAFKSHQPGPAEGEWWAGVGCGSKMRILGFFLVELVAVLGAREAMQLAGVGTFSPFVAGVVSGVAALLGAALFWRSSSRQAD